MGRHVLGWKKNMPQLFGPVSSDVMGFSLRYRSKSWGHVTVQTCWGKVASKKHTKASKSKYNQHNDIHQQIPPAQLPGQASAFSMAWMLVSITFRRGSCDACQFRRRRGAEP